ncbi:hypothetical protein HII31_12081 [Pseudocercospora fuligena]|uniref:Uncharacterized protein n=1 Tax=Pseudocercospora fuligena TaxID=685502 RepID=A0A8H6VBU8_9PEZI|nr:hypothetical protein HII31_12081 [Pseudocercospora fuligena]
MYDIKFDTAPQEMDIRGSFVFAADMTSTVVNRFYVDNSIFIGCSFEECTLEDVTISNCVFVGATFVRCKFSDVIWQNVRKVDTVTTGKDLTKHSEVLSTSPKEISNPEWLPTLLSLNDPLTDWKFASERKKSSDGEQAKSTEAASPSPSASQEESSERSPASRPSTPPDAEQDGYVMPEPETMSHGAATDPPPLATPKPFTIMTRAACEKWFNEKNLWGYRMSNEARNMVRRSRGKAFPFMHLPAHLRIKVYNSLLCPSDIVIVDRPQEYLGPAALNGQLQYKMWNKFCGKERAWSTTYLITSSDGPDNSTMIETAILRTSKRVYNESVPRLYDRKIVFNCSAEGALSWMHDVSINLSKITTLVFTYRV